MQKISEKRKETNARAQINNRELHLELVGNKVTYVRAY